MKTLTSLLLAILVSQNLFASARDTGGGDPMTLEFIAKGEKLVQWIKAHPEKVSVSAEAVNDQVQSLLKSLDSHETAKLSFTKEELKDANGVSKPALFDRSAGTIRVNGRAWDQAGEVGRYKIAALELLGLAGSQSRYEEVMNIQSQLSTGVVRCVGVDIYSFGSQAQKTIDYPIFDTPDAERFQFQLPVQSEHATRETLLQVDILVTKQKDQNTGNWVGYMLKASVSDKNKVIFADDHSKYRGIKGGGWGSFRSKANNDKRIIYCAVGDPAKMASEYEITHKN